MMLSITRYDCLLGAGPMHTASSASSTCSAPASASEYTATVAMPMRRAVLITLQAISPLFAIRIFLNIGQPQFEVKSLSDPARAGQGGDAGCDETVRQYGEEQTRKPTPPCVMPDRSERDVPVLAPGVIQLLVLQHRQRTAHALARLVRHDHVVDETARARHEGVGEARLVLGFPCGDFLRVVLLAAEDDLDRALGAHHRDLGRRPGQIHIAAQML